MEHMKRLVEKYFFGYSVDLTVLDIGSTDVNGSYKNLFNKGVQYLGLDLAEGRNVDMVLKNPYDFPISSNTADLVISGQAFEHIEFFWLTWMEIVRVTKEGGFIFLIAPSRGPEHRYPVDCWRFYPDGYRALAKLGFCELVEIKVDWEPHQDSESAQWGDCVGVFKKLQRSRLKKFYEFTSNFIHKKVDCFGL
jgi:SAM-dependent methyltransferase